MRKLEAYFMRKNIKFHLTSNDGFVEYLLTKIHKDLKSALENYFYFPINLF